jgi:hypothetical protein
MLNYFRQHPLRKSLWLIVLFASILTQAQNIFACELMDSGPQTKCCCDEDMSKGCPMGGGCDTDIPDGVTLTGCCDVSTNINVGLQDVAVVADSHHNKQVTSLDAPQPPPVILTNIELFIPLSNDSNALFGTDLALSLSSPGTHTYLITNRFRI